MLARTCLVLTLGILVAAASAQAAFKSEACLAQKRKAQGKLQQCRATEDAKTLQGKVANQGKCATKFQEQLAKLALKASKAAVECRYVDNGDGTVTDYDTGLQWEKKVSPGGGLADPHDGDNTYAWNGAGGGTSPNGTLFTDFLGRLNDCRSAPNFIPSVGFAGHCDWRIPTLVELQTILVEPPPCGTDPCIDPFFGPTKRSNYWTATTNAADTASGWRLHFITGAAGVVTKNTIAFARAVRGGL